MCAREVRSGNSRRKVRNKGGTTTRRPSFALLIEEPVFSYENTVSSYDETFGCIESSRSYRENPMRATSD